MSRSKAAPRPPRLRIRALGAAAARVFLGALRRGYAAVLIGIILWATWEAFAYLYESLLMPREAPAQITGLPVHLDASLLSERRTAFAGLTAAEHPRSPPAHYHRMDGWFQPDSFNDCTRSGCHSPLPHQRRKEVRAFLNMHATGLHCGVCHFKSDPGPLPLVWYDLTTGRIRNPPALLEAFGWLNAAVARGLQAPFTEQDQAKIMGLMDQAAREADDEPGLVELARHLAAVRAASPQFRQFVEAALDLVPRHFRGEYNAKLAIRAGSQTPLLGHPAAGDAEQRLLRLPADAPPGERERLVAAAHPLKRAQALACTDCHRPDAGILDFKGAGYPAARIEMLTSGPVFRMIENIAAGRTMEMPAFLAPQSAEPGSTQPDRRP